MTFFFIFNNSIHEVHGIHIDISNEHLYIAGETIVDVFKVVVVAVWQKEGYKNDFA